MAISTIVKQLCKECGKVAVEKSRITFGANKLIILECGHVVTEEVLQKADYSTLTSSDGKMKLMPFQIEGVEFAERANCRVLIADEQALALMKLHFDELTPTVIATKATIKTQWMNQIRNWIPAAKVQVLYSGKEIAVPGFDVYVTSYAMLTKHDVWKHIEPKTLILDECQAITNHLANRSKGAQKIGKNCEHVIALSGTPIRNNAGEYFTILNLIQPRMFPEYQRFINEDCDAYSNGWSQKVGGLKNPERFKEKTKDFIIRRVQADVLPDLFALQQPRQFHHVELDRKLNKAYADALKELDDLMYNDELSKSDMMANQLAIMNKMRQITGISKTYECADYITEHIESTGRRIAIFAHHHAAIDMLEAETNKWLEEHNYGKCIVVRAGDDSSQKLKLLDNDKNYVLLCSGLASGEGMDGLQHLCSDIILLERFWNPAAEEQIEKRLVRMGQTKPVNIIYMIASGTIDEYFTELVEQKRAIVSSTLDNKEIEWSQQSLMSELANLLVTTGKKAWKL
jgi:SWI/SNF-related matrix-associated actin-dependent regulator of chromatin subfamily A-like protein 1